MITGSFELYLFLAAYEYILGGYFLGMALEVENPSMARMNKLYMRTMTRRL